MDCVLFSFATHYINFFFLFNFSLICFFFHASKVISKTPLMSKVVAIMNRRS